MPSFTSISAVAILTLSLFALRVLLKRRQTSSPLPPGPRGFPIVGCVISPHYGELPWLKFADLSKEYGSDVISYTSFGKTTIVLNSFKAAADLLDKRSSSYSDRPRMIMADELMGWHWNFAHIPYSDRWRRHRRAFHQYFQPRNLASYHPVQMKVAINLLEQLSVSPEKFDDHIRQMVGSVVLRTAYGYDVTAENDYYINLIHTAILPLLEVVHAGTYIVEYLPVLKHVPGKPSGSAWFPGAAFKWKAAVSAQYATDVVEVPFKNVKLQMEDGTAQQSFVADSLQRIMSENSSNVVEEEETVRNCAGIMYLAGSDTTVSLLMAWQLAMLHHPEVQKRAQTEVDAVCGRTRLPDFDDRALMPYVEAVILETMRWHAIVPLSLLHRAMHDDEYNGYHIPAGATVTPNAWAILHDPETYTEPFKFIPERFLDEEQKNITFDRQPDPTVTGAFGYGRRICPGRHLATNTAWIAIASILATYDLVKARDAKGNTIEPEVKFKDGLVSHAEPYKMQYMPRFDEVPKVIATAKLTTA